MKFLLFINIFTSAIKINAPFFIRGISKSESCERNSHLWQSIVCILDAAISMGHDCKRRASDQSKALLDNFESGQQGLSKRNSEASQTRSSRWLHCVFGGAVWHRRWYLGRRRNDMERAREINGALLLQSPRCYYLSLEIERPSAVVWK